MNLKEVFHNMSMCQDENDESDGVVSCKLPFLTLCPSRWLVRGEVLVRILGNWNDLKTNFSSATFDQNSRYKARTLIDMLHDDVNYLNICFITPVVIEFDKINKFFQATDADTEAMNQQLHMLYVSLKRRLFDIHGNQLSISRVDFGAKFASESLRCSREHQNSSFEIQLLNVKERCVKFILDLVAQIELRLPANKNIFAGLSLSTSGKLLSHVNRAPFGQLPFQQMLRDSEDVDEIEEQHRKIILHPWSEEKMFQ